MVSREASLFFGLLALIALIPLVVIARVLPEISLTSRTSNGGDYANYLIGGPDFDASAAAPGLGGFPGGPKNGMPNHSLILDFYHFILFL